MALGKLWNALFGKRAAAEQNPSVQLATQEQSQSSGKGAPQLRSTASPSTTSQTKTVAGKKAAAGGLAITAQPGPATDKVKKKSAGKRDKKTVAPLQIAITPVVETPPQRTIRIAQPKKNAWTKLLSGRRIESILDTNLGDASRAVEILEAIVCDAAPIPKYVAIDLFELGSGSLTVTQFHQRVRRVGGQAVAIPAQLSDGLRELSRTLGTVDLVLLDGGATDLEQLEQRRLLTRITHSESLVLQRDARGKWQSIEAIVPVMSLAVHTRKAA
jgi:hypothetical protein